MAIASGILLAVYLGGILYAIHAPARGPDPQRGMAIGCLWIVAGGIAMAGVVLAVGVFFHHDRLVHFLFVVSVFPAIAVIPGALSSLLKRGRPRR